MGNRIAQRVLLSLALALAPDTRAQNWYDPFIDDSDGQFDVSEWLLDKKGFLPVPIIITEPAVGFGGGLAAAFFRESIREISGRKSPSGGSVPPDIFVAAAAATDNGTKFGAVGGIASFAGDYWRYRGGVARVSPNLDFYGIGGRLGNDSFKIAYNLDGWASLQQVLRRIGNTDAWMSARWIYLDLKSTLKTDREGDALLPDLAFAQRSSGLGTTLEYDSRDNIFTPSRGWTGSLDLTFYAPAWGSTNEFQSYRAHVFAYWPVLPNLILGGRLDGRMARGDVPFYMYPFIDMRGVPVGRVQDENTGVVEAELRWDVTPRWALIGFAGAGRAWGLDKSFADASTVVTKGLGFRYLIARRLGLYAGMDYAWSNLDQAFYIQVGGAWR